MNALLFIDSLVIGGAQRQFLNLAEGLKDRGHGVLICTYYPLNGILEGRDFDIPVECFEKSSRFDLSPIAKLRKAIKRFRPDVVVAFLSTPSIYAELSRITGHSVPVIVSERNGPSSGKPRAMEYLAPPLHLLASSIVFNNESYMNLMGRRFPPIRKRSRLIYNGVDSKFFKPAVGFESSEQSAHSTEHDTGKHTRFCTVAARASAEKGLFELIHAAANLKNRMQGTFTIDWIGPDNTHTEQVSDALKLIDSLGLKENWQWLGVRNDLDKLFKRYDIMLVPSLREGLSNVMCEAMASGLPCVATDIADHRRIIEASKSGLICQAGDSESLAQAMQQMIEQSKSTLAKQAQNARTFASENFTIENYIDNWIRVIGDVAR